MDPEADAVRAALAPGESLLWSGRPGGLRLADGLPLGGLLSAYVAWSVLFRGGVSLRVTAALAVVVLGLSVLEMVARGRTHYGVTSNRIIIATHLPKARVISFDLLTVGELHIEHRRGDTGTLVLEPATFGLLEGVTLPAESDRPPSPEFHRIKDPDAVLEIIQKARAALERPGKAV